MFDKDFYLNLVNLEYRNELEKPKFDPTRPARYFAENSASLAEEISATTLASFEKMFKTFNAFCAP